MKIPRRYSSLLFAGFMALALPLIMTFFVTVINLGFTARFLVLWMKSYCIAAIVAFPLILVLAPVLRKAVSCLTAEAENKP